MTGKPAMPPGHGNGWRRVGRAFFASLRGMRSAWRYEAAFRQEVCLALLLLPLSLLLPATAAGHALMVCSVLLVLVVELLNSAIEAAIDRISSEWHELSGRAKDLGSAAVFVALCNVPITWALAVFWRP